MRNLLKKIINIILSFSNDIIYFRKIKKIFNLQNKKYKNHLEHKLIKAHKEKWNVLTNRINDKWFKIYFLITNISNINFIPENIYYNIVEPRLNNKMFDMAYSDKNFYDQHFDIDVFPYVYLRNINSVFYDHHYNQVHPRHKLQQN